MSTKRVVLERAPEVDPTYHHEGSPWASRWVAHPAQAPDQTAVVAYRLRFTMEKPATIRAYVSADQRYELFVDGERAGRGSERGDRQNWYFEAYDLDLPAGDHVIVARTWWLHPSVPSPYAQVSVRPAFWFHAEGEHQKILSTGLGAWEAKILDGYSFHLERQHAFGLVDALAQHVAHHLPVRADDDDGHVFGMAVAPAPGNRRLHRRGRLVHGHGVTMVAVLVGVPAQLHAIFERLRLRRGHTDAAGEQGAGQQARGSWMAHGGSPWSVSKPVM